MTQPIFAITKASASPRRAIGPAFASNLRAEQCAREIMKAFAQYDAAFRAVTARAAERFQLRDWQGSQADAAERSELCERFVRYAVHTLKSQGKLTRQPSFLREVQFQFAGLADALPDAEFSRAFFRAVLFGAFKSAAANYPGESASFAFGADQSAGERIALRRFGCRGSMRSTIAQWLRAAPLEADWQSVDAASERIVECLNAKFRPGTAMTVDSLEALDAVFYRFTRAYLIGRITDNRSEMPFALELSNSEMGVVMENVLLGEAALNDLFGCARSCFHVELDRTTDTVAYLKALAPEIAVEKLFAVLGRPLEADDFTRAPSRAVV
jgi:isocitrate dehydrogenase kinase/phosphatase